MNLAPYIDHTVLKPGLLLSDVEKVCKEAVEYGFYAVCVPPMMVKTAINFLHHLQENNSTHQPKVATVIGFPFGYAATEAKLAETLLAIADGVDELDVVINYTAIKNNDWQLAADEINHIMPIIKIRNKVIKVIIESGILTHDEIIKCCDLYGTAGVDFMKTSTGYAEKGASVEAVTLMRKHLNDAVQIKASGGIRDDAFARALVNAGATRLGCSNSIEIVNGGISQGNY